MDIIPEYSLKVKHIIIYDVFTVAVLFSNALFMHVVIFLSQKSHINFLQINKELGTQYDTSKL